MRYNKYGLPEENNNDQYKDYLKIGAIGIGVTIITCILIASFLFIYKSC